MVSLFGSTNPATSTPAVAIAPGNDVKTPTQSPRTTPKSHRVITGPSKSNDVRDQV
jgi:hypothetical protein